MHTCNWQPLAAIRPVSEQSHCLGPGVFVFCCSWFRWDLTPSDCCRRMGFDPVKERQKGASASGELSHRSPSLLRPTGRGQARRLRRLREARERGATAEATGPALSVRTPTPGPLGDGCNSGRSSGDGPPSSGAAPGCFLCARVRFSSWGMFFRGLLPQTSSSGVAVRTRAVRRTFLKRSGGGLKTGHHVIHVCLTCTL